MMSDGNVIFVVRPSGGSGRLAVLLIMVLGLVLCINKIIHELSVTSPGTGRVVLWVALSLWLVAGVFVLLELLYAAIGRRVVSVQRNQIVVARLMGDWTLGRAKKFRMEMIDLVRVEQRAYAAKGKKWTAHVVTLDIADRRSDLLDRLTRKQADALAEAILELLPHRCRGALPVSPATGGEIEP